MLSAIRLLMEVMRHKDGELVGAADEHVAVVQLLLSLDQVMTHISTKIVNHFAVSSESFTSKRMHMRACECALFSCYHLLEMQTNSSLQVWAIYILSMFG